LVWSLKTNERRRFAAVGTSTARGTTPPVLPVSPTAKFMNTKTTLYWILSAGAAAALSSCVDNYGGAPYGGGYGGGEYVEALPPRYVTEYYGGEPYYVSNGVYYRHYNGRYMRVERPHGLRPGPGRPGPGHIDPGYGRPMPGHYNPDHAYNKGGGPIKGPIVSGHPGGQYHTQGTGPGSGPKTVYEKKVTNKKVIESH